MASGKLKLIKYITYGAFIGVIMVFYFGTEISTIVNTHPKTCQTWSEAIAVEKPKEYKHH
ncbi:hypothetical protein [Candidatus Mycoplasma mahonii]|uniref:hypothetical protein n=1 Tax=Candidatus Mycoplasma mahonii TaxID=3004105 RepID=UPI0026EDDFF2|nr:hypothetical protein [Candidatus Mycoplasma mahonii]WKX02662.1 hypothetical protein O3I44_01115 [Candidatus Mycoplasma mahonii]